MTLTLRGLREVKITWLYNLLKLPTSSNLKTLNVEGCERLTLADLRELQAVCEGRVAIVHDAKEDDDSIGEYRRYIEFLSTDPSLPQRLGERPNEEIKKELAAMGKAGSSSGGGVGSSGGSGSGSGSGSSGGSSSSSSTSRPHPPPRIPTPPQAKSGN